jgi:hypothetical protein
MLEQRIHLELAFGRPVVGIEIRFLICRLGVNWLATANLSPPQGFHDSFG